MSVDQGTRSHCWKAKALGSLRDLSSQTGGATQHTVQGRVVDVGCGGGVVTRDLARRVTTGGRVVGVDPSPALQNVAREFASQAHLGDVVDFRVGDARALPFREAEFDTAIAVTVLVHIPAEEGAISEMTRVVRLGGRVGDYDVDLDSFLVSHPDRALTRRIVAAHSDNYVVNSWLSRRLPGLLREAGLEDVWVRAFTPLEQDSSGFCARQAAARADLALKAGAITEPERDR